MGGWRVLPRGEMMSASVADTRVDLVSSSTFDVPLVILAESHVLDRSIFSVGTPSGETTAGHGLDVSGCRAVYGFISNHTQTNV